MKRCVSIGCSSHDTEKATNCNFYKYSNVHHCPSFVPESDSPVTIPNHYCELDRILSEARQQSSHGKGKERHATGEPWHKQPIVTMSEKFGTNHGPLFQAKKKINESIRLDSKKAKHELLGAIVYIAAAIYLTETSLTTNGENEK